MEAITFAGILGAVAGSFLNVVSYRLPRRESLVAPASLSLITARIAEGRQPSRISHLDRPLPGAAELGRNHHEGMT